MRRIIPFLLLAFLVAGCSEDRANPFDPSSDREPPQLTDFDVSTDNGVVVATWAASEPVRAVVEWGSDAAELHNHSYTGSREWVASGATRLLEVASSREYAYAVRMTDRAGNEAIQFLETEPTFTTGAVDTEPLFLLVMIDVGWGDALYMESTDGKRILIDSGHPWDAPIVADFLVGRGATFLDVASMSHVHSDHIGGFTGDDFGDIPGLFTGRGIRARYFLDILDKTPFTENGPYQRLLAALPASQAMHLKLPSGSNKDNVDDPDAFDWGEGVQVDLLAAGEKPYVNLENALETNMGSVQNNDSMVWRVQYKGFVALLTGDGEFATEEYLMGHYAPEVLRSTIHKLGHHGSNDSNSERFMDVTTPIVALITNSVLENPGVMHPYVLGRLRARQIDYYASDRVIPNRDRALPGVRGDVYIRTDGGAFTITVDRIRYE